jgi:SAM-dependent methyltransferase
MNDKIEGTKFDSLVALYERLAEPVSRPAAARALALAKLAQDAHVIDVATGTGILAVLAAEAGARVLATDLSPEMTTRAGERLRTYPGCDAEVMAADRLDVPDERFDAAFSCFGVLQLPDWQQGLSELARVTKPGGRIAVSTWTSARDAAPALLLKRVFETCFPDRKLWPSNDTAGRTADGLRDAMHQAGCGETEVEIVRGAWTLPSSSEPGQALARALDDTDPMFRMFPGYAALTPEEHGRLRSSLVQALEGYSDADGAIRVPTEAFVAVAVRPQA